MKTIITRAYTVQAAHQLHGLREGHKCGRMHGHNYRIEITVAGPVDARGFVLDAEEIDLKVGQPMMAALDHRTLNDVIPQPTAENIAAWVMLFCESAGLSTCRVRVQENERLWAEVES